LFVKLNKIFNTHKADRNDDLQYFDVINCMCFNNQNFSLWLWVCTKHNVVVWLMQLCC